MSATYGAVVFAKEFGARGDGLTDDTAALQAGIDAAFARKIPFRIQAGTFILTAQLLVRSKQDVGGQRGATVLRQTTPGQAVIASHNYVAGNAGPSGQMNIHDLVISGEPTDRTSHGIIFRDYLSQLENLIVVSCGGNGVHMTQFNSAGAAYGGSSMVDNRITEVDARDCKGFGLFLGELDNNKFTDAYVHHIYVSAGFGAPGNIFCGSSGGWKFHQIHTYGQIVPVAFEANNLNHTEFGSLYVEGNWTAAGIRLRRVQQAVTLDNLSIKSSVGSTSGAALDIVSRSALAAEASLSIGSIIVVQDYDTPVNGIVLATSTICVDLGQFNIDGRFKSRITRFGGFASAFIPYVKNTSTNLKVRDSVAGVTLAVNDIPLALSGRKAWSGHAAQSVTIQLPELKTFQAVHGSIAVASATHYNRGASARWRADLLITSRGAAEPWAVYPVDMVAPMGFDVAPTVTIDRVTKLLTVAFTATSAAGYGTVSMLLEYS